MSYSLEVSFTNVSYFLLEFFRCCSTEEKVDPKKVMVGGMPYYITEDDIHEFFKECGTIAELDCMTFVDTGKFKGIAFITFRVRPDLYLHLWLYLALRVHVMFPGCHVVSLKHASDGYFIGRTDDCYMLSDAVNTKMLMHAAHFRVFIFYMHMIAFYRNNR